MGKGGAGKGRPRRSQGQPKASRPTATTPNTAPPRTPPPTPQTASQPLVGANASPVGSAAQRSVALVATASRPAKPRKRIPAIPGVWEQFFLCVVFHLALPLLPLAIEFWQKHTVTNSSLTLGAAMYAISIGGSSKSKLMFGSMVVVCIVYSIAFGVLVSHPPPPMPVAGAPPPVLNTAANMYAGWAMLAIFFVHAMERYNRHVVDSTPYWEF